MGFWFFRSTLATLNEKLYASLYNPNILLFSPSKRWWRNACAQFLITLLSLVGSARARLFFFFRFLLPKYHFIAHNQTRMCPRVRQPYHLLHIISAMHFSLIRCDAQPKKINAGDHREEIYSTRVLLFFYFIRCVNVIEFSSCWYLFSFLCSILLECPADGGRRIFCHFLSGRDV